MGRLGTFTFDPGLYCYVGRSKTHLRQRLARHSRKEKTTRWHIDHLLPHTSIRVILLFPLEGLTECILAQSLARQGGIPFPTGFGASECSCPGHLILLSPGKLTENPRLNKVRLNQILEWLKPTGGEQRWISVSARGKSSCANP